MFEKLQLLVFPSPWEGLGEGLRDLPTFVLEEGSTFEPTLPT